MTITAKCLICLAALPAAWQVAAQTALPEIELYAGMVIEQSCRVKPGNYALSGGDAPAITIRGEGIVVDFNGAVLNGARAGQFPDAYTGTGIHISGRRIHIQNLNARGYKVALYAEGTDSLSITDCDLSYNYRQRLHSMREREDLSDWLSYHLNENDEWLRYGAAAYLKDCNHATVRGLRVTGGQNGLMLMRCNGGLFYNNTIHFNSGIGIGLYRSSNNRIAHNRLDWNVRGYSHGFYSRGQDSAGILCYEQSNDNVFAFNSATHSGDGLFLWAGQHTMDTGEGGCNRNVIASNDFSHSPTNGIEVTFSSNVITGNRLEDCTYGIWGGYSWNTRIFRNRIAGNNYGIAIEHGQGIAIEYNYFSGNRTGIRLWQRSSQPADWPYAQKRDVRSRDYNIRANVFDGDSIPLRIAGSEKVAVNDFNVFWNFRELLVSEQPNKDFYFVKNTVHQPAGWGAAETLKKMNHVARAPSAKERMAWEPRTYGQFSAGKTLGYAFSHAGSMDAMLPAGHPRGRHEMRITEWGPYDHRRPIAWLHEIRDSVYTFVLLGPEGRWRLAGAQGFEWPSRQSGAIPDTVGVRRLPGREDLRLDFEFTGSEITDEQGGRIPAGEPAPFSFRRFEKPLTWRVRFYHYEGEELPLAEFDVWDKRRPVKDTAWHELAGRWWGSPAPGVAPDRFVTLAETEFEAQPGLYVFTLSSDDGVRMWLDGEQVLDQWSIHEPRTDELRLALGGRHRLRIAHFDAGGIATLDFRMRRD